MMAAPHEKIFVNTSQLKSEKTGLHGSLATCAKSSQSVEFIIGTTNAEAKGYKNNKQKAFYSVLQCVGQKSMPMIMSCLDQKVKL